MSKVTDEDGSSRLRPGSVHKKLDGKPVSNSLKFCKMKKTECKAPSKSLVGNLSGENHIQAD